MYKVKEDGKWGQKKVQWHHLLVKRELKSGILSDINASWLPLLELNLQVEIPKGKTQYYYLRPPGGQHCWLMKKWVGKGCWTCSFECWCQQPHPSTPLGRNEGYAIFCSELEVPNPWEFSLATKIHIKFSKSLFCDVVCWHPRSAH